MEVIPKLNFWHIVSIFISLLGIFISLVILLHKRGNRTANVFLSILVMVFSLRLLEIIGYWSRYLIEFPSFIAMTHPFLYLFGPLLFFYALFLINERTDISLKDFIHLLPFLLNVIIFLPYYFLDSDVKEQLLISIFSGGRSTAPSILILIYIMQIPHLLLYCFVTYAIIRDYNQRIKNNFSEIAIINLKWLMQLVALFGFFCACWMLYGILIGFGVEYNPLGDYILTFGMTLFMLSISVKALTQPEIHLSLNELNKSVKYENSSLTEESSNQIRNKLTEMMEREKPYLKNNLKLEELARLLNVSTHQLSQVINERIGFSFFDFINKYRVEEFKQKVISPVSNELTILAIALESGFNNKTSFNNAFKKFTGTTPAAYRKNKFKIAR